MSTHTLNVQPARTARHSGQLHTNVSKTDAYVTYTHNSDHKVNIIYIKIYKKIYKKKKKNKQKKKQKKTKTKQTT